MHHYLTFVFYTCRLKGAQQRAPKEFKAFYECMDYYRYVIIICQRIDVLGISLHSLNLVYNKSRSAFVVTVIYYHSLQQQI